MDFILLKDEESLKGVILRHVYVQSSREHRKRFLPGSLVTQKVHCGRGLKVGGLEEERGDPANTSAGEWFYCCRGPRSRSLCETFGKTTV